eukprot:436016_1
MNLSDSIKEFVVFNVDKEESTIASNQIAMNPNINGKSYIISDADEELLILVEFHHITHLTNIKIHCLAHDDTTISAPKKVDVFKIKHLNINFDDIRSMTADKSIKCSIKKLSNGQNINLYKNPKLAVKFQKIKFLAVYIKSNQNDTEQTYLNAITFHGPSKYKIDPNNTKDEQSETKLNVDTMTLAKKDTNRIKSTSRAHVTSRHLSEQHLLDEWIISDVDHIEELNVIRTIFAQIIEEPSNEQYRILNYNQLFKAINQCEICLSILCNFGFKRNNDLLTIDLHVYNNFDHNFLFVAFDAISDDILYSFRTSWNICIGHISLEKNKKQLGLLSKLFENILNNPKDANVRDLNFDVICNKFIECKSCAIMLFAAGFKKVEDRLKLDENDIKQLIIVNNALQAKIHQMKNANSNGFDANKSRFSITELSYFSLLSRIGQCDCPFCGRPIISKTYVAKEGIMSRCSRCGVEASGGDIYFECIQHNAGIHDVVIPGHLYTLCENCGLIMQQSVNHHPTLITMNESGNIDDMVRYMMNMGFSRNSVLYAIEISKVEINLALSYLIYRIRPHQITLTRREIPQNYNQILPTKNEPSSIEFKTKNDVDCPDISSCAAFLRLKKILKSHHNGKLNNQSVNMLNISMTLNDYHHLLHEHSSDNEFEWIAESLGNCIRSKCLKLQATYRDRSIEPNQKCIRTSARYQILDKIHCHFYHCYDSGYKLRQNQRNQIQHLHDSMTTNDQLLESIECTNSIINNINNMLSSNRKRNRNIQYQERVHKFNQLSDSNTVINDEKINNDQKVNNQNYDIYSYGIKFYYWKWYQNSQNNSPKTNYAKYKSFKEELMQNAIAKISCQQFDTEMKKAAINHKTKFCKKRIAKPNYISTTHWGIKNNAKIKVQHLISILIYCGYDVLQYHFSKTFRRNNPTENVASVKVRNAEFFHLSKLLYETVNIYGILCGGNENKTKSFYHGINK